MFVTGERHVVPGTSISEPPAAGEVVWIGFESCRVDLQTNGKFFYPVFLPPKTLFVIQKKGRMELMCKS